MCVSETWLRVDIQNVQNFKDWTDIARDIQILIIGFPLHIQQNKDWVKWISYALFQKIITLTFKFGGK